MKLTVDELRKMMERMLASYKNAIPPVAPKTDAKKEESPEVKK